MDALLDWQAALRDLAALQAASSVFVIDEFAAAAAAANAVQNLRVRTRIIRLRQRARRRRTRAYANGAVARLRRHHVLAAIAEAAARAFGARPNRVALEIFNAAAIAWIHFCKVCVVEKNLFCINRA